VDEFVIHWLRAFVEVVVCDWAGGAIRTGPTNQMLMYRPTKCFHIESIASVVLIVHLLMSLLYVRTSVICLDCNQITALWTHRIRVVLIHSGFISRSQWPHGLRRGCAVACLLRLGSECRWQHCCLSLVFIVYCLVRSLCIGLVTCGEESYREWSVWV
jgi:hypothetical protein